MTHIIVKNYSTNLIEKSLHLEDPFLKAEKENERIEFQIEQERIKLSEFKLKVKQRLKVYKHVENKIDEDRQLVISKNNELKQFKSSSSLKSATSYRDLSSNQSNSTNRSDEQGI